MSWAKLRGREQELLIRFSSSCVTKENWGGILLMVGTVSSHSLHNYMEDWGSKQQNMAPDSASIAISCFHTYSGNYTDRHLRKSDQTFCWNERKNRQIHLGKGRQIHLLLNGSEAEFNTKNKLPFLWIKQLLTASQFGRMKASYTTIKSHSRKDLTWVRR